jgi:hypothetical protein
MAGYIWNLTPRNEGLFVETTNFSEMPNSPGLKPLGSLAQSARGKELNTARSLLLFIGFLTMAVNGFMFANAEKEVDKVIQAELTKAGPGAVVQEDAKTSILALTRMIYGGTAALGLVFVICGLLIKKYPVPLSLTALTLYLAGNAVFALLNPLSLAAGIVIKVIIIFGLVKAVQAAFAYQKEQNLARAGGELA